MTTTTSAYAVAGVCLPVLCTSGIFAHLYVHSRHVRTALALMAASLVWCVAYAPLAVHRANVDDVLAAVLFVVSVAASMLVVYAYTKAAYNTACACVVWLAFGSVGALTALHTVFGRIALLSYFTAASLYSVWFTTWLSLLAFSLVLRRNADLLLPLARAALRRVMFVRCPDALPRGNDVDGRATPPPDAPWPLPLSEKAAKNKV